MAGRAMSGIGAALQQFGTDWRRNQMVDNEDKREAEKLRAAIEKDKADQAFRLQEFEQQKLKDERQTLLEQLPFLQNVDESVFGKFDKAGLGGVFSKTKDISEQNVPQEFLMEGESIQQQAPSFTRNLTSKEQIDQFNLTSGRDEKSKQDAALAQLNNPEFWKQPAERRNIMAQMAGLKEIPETFEEWKAKEAFKQAGELKQAQVYAGSRQPVGTTPAGIYSANLSDLSTLWGPQLRKLADDGDVAGYQALVDNLKKQAAESSGFTQGAPTTVSPQQEFQQDMQDFEADWKQALQKAKNDPYQAKVLMKDAAKQRSWGKDANLSAQYLQLLRAK